MRSSLAVVVILAVGCGDGVAFLSSEGLAMVVLVDTAGSAARATAYDVSDPSAALKTPAASAEVFALGFLEAPDDLVPGPIALADQGLAFPKADRHYQLDGSEWVALGAPPAQIGGLRVAPPNTCLQLETTKVAFPQPASFAVALGPDRVLIGAPGGALYDVTSEGFLERIDLSTTTPSLGAFVRGDEVFLVGRGTRFMRGHPDRGFVDGPQLARPLGGDVVLDGARAPHPLELFVTDESLAVQHFDGTAWRVLREPSIAPDSDHTRSGIARLGPGLAMLIGTADETGVEIRTDGTSRPVRFDIEADLQGDGLWVISSLPSVGPVVGTLRGSAHHLEQGQWGKRPEPTTGARLDVLVDLGERRFLGGGDLGVFIQWGPGDDDVCPELTDIGLDNAYAAAPLGGGFVVVSGSGALGWELITATVRPN